jgi:hypothetical protein
MWRRRWWLLEKRSEAVYYIRDTQREPENIDINDEPQDTDDTKQGKYNGQEHSIDRGLITTATM